MPRPNKRREIFAEDNLAERVAIERDARGWTNDGLAKRMSDAGCPMTGSAIFKIEKAEPRRRIVVDELVAFAKVFGLPMDELLLPPQIAAANEFKRLALLWSQAVDASVPLLEARDAATDAMLSYAKAHPEVYDETTFEFLDSLGPVKEDPTPPSGRWAGRSPRRIAAVVANTLKGIS